MSRQRQSSKFIKVLLSIVFLLFALVQLNDPDPYVWFAIYLITATLWAASVFRKIPSPLLFGFALILLFYAAMHAEFVIEWFYSEHRGKLFDEMQEEKPYLEGTREFFGLLIALLSLLYLIRQNQFKMTK